MRIIRGDLLKLALAGEFEMYDAIAAAMASVKKQFSGKTIGYPRIGAGLAGGDWSVIAPIIDCALDGETHTLVEYAAYLFRIPKRNADPH
jgi:O-acetyl-ADP-ribose deacetylase (regulator of RNase III)